MKSDLLADLLNREFPWVVAHRGDSVHCPENTLASFCSAFEKGADLIELDLRLSRDRELVVIHDKTLERTTNGYGPVADLDFAELREFDCGGWFDPRFQEERVPCLKEVLELMSDQIALNLEIKSDVFDAEAEKDAIESRVCEQVYEYGLQDQVVVSSFEHRCLSRVRNHRNPLPVAPLLNRHASQAEINRLVQSLRAFSCHNNHKYLGQELIRELKERGIGLLAYTVNEEQRMQELAEWGITGIITNNPAKLRELLKQ